jgi:hypothetical protein
MKIFELIHKLEVSIFYILSIILQKLKDKHGKNEIKF